MLDIPRLIRRMRSTVEVPGRPLHAAKYLEAGICRMRWLAVPGILVKVTTIAVALIVVSSLHKPTNMPVWAWLGLADAAPTVALVWLLVVARGQVSIGRARFIAVVTSLGLTLPTALGVGISGLDENALPVMSMTLLVVLIIAPLRATALVLIALSVLAMAAGSAVLTPGRDADPLGLLVLWFPMAVAAFGIAMNLWYARNYRTMWKAERTLRRKSNEVRRDRVRIERLLTSALPKPVSDELQRTSRFPSRIAEVCVIAVDICGFSHHCKQMPAQLVVEELQRFFRAFEACCQKYRVEPLRAQGDGVLAIGGLWPQQGGEARQIVIDAVLAALEFRRLLSSGDGPGGEAADDHATANLWPARVGIHIGPAVLGVINGVRLSFDVWGDTVNMAARLEQGAGRNAIMLSERALWATRGLFDHGPIRELKVKESVLPAVAEVTGIAEAYRTVAGEPNAAFWQVYQALEYPPIRPAAGGSLPATPPASYRLPGTA